MKKFLLFCIITLTCQAAQADVILLKDGRVIEGKIIQVRSSFVRIQSEYKAPFREFLIENIANIEQSSPDETSQLAVRNIHQRSINNSYNKKVQDAVNKRANSLIEDAIQSSESFSLQSASDEVKAAVQKKASTLIEEAVNSVDTPLLENAPQKVKEIAKKKAGGLIEEAVKDVEVSPLRDAPEGIQIAAKRAATILIEGAVKDVRGQGRDMPINVEGVPISAENAATMLVKEIVRDVKSLNLSQPLTPPGAKLIEPVEVHVSDPQPASSVLVLTAKDQIIGGLLILLLYALLWIKIGDRRKASGITAEGIIAALLEKEQTWTERRKYRRVKRKFPILLNLDNILPIFAKVKNISLGGAYAVCDDAKLLRLGDQCQFSLTSPKNRIDPDFKVNCKARVVRIRPDHSLGLKFFDLDQSSFNGLQRILA